MSDFIRPEARAALRRWREALTGVAVLALGLWWLISVRGLLSYVGAVVVLCGAAILWIGLQRGRFRSSGLAVGTVQVDEGQIVYFGPETGGAVAVADLDRIALLELADQPRTWRLDAQGAAALHIPIDAQGADALFDVFATLPGLRTERMLAEMRRDPARTVVIWERAGPGPRPLQLH